MVNPPAGWKPAGWNAARQAVGGKTVTGRLDFAAGRDAAHRRSSTCCWSIFVFSGMAGLMTIGIIKLFGIDALKAEGLNEAEAEAAATAGTAMAVFYALANGIGRIVWGTASRQHRPASAPSRS